MRDIKETTKLLAEYLGWRYIGFKSGEKDLKLGWYRTQKRGLPKIIEASMLRKNHWIVLDDNTLGKYVCRSHNELRFYNSFDWLFEVVLDLMSDTELSVIVDAAPRVMHNNIWISEYDADLGIREQLFFALGDAVKYLKNGKKVNL